MSRPMTDTVDDSRRLSVSLRVPVITISSILILFRCERVSVIAQAWETADRKSAKVRNFLYMKELFLFFYKCIDERNTLLWCGGVGT